MSHELKIKNIKNLKNFFFNIEGTKLFGLLILRFELFTCIVGL